MQQVIMILKQLSILLLLSQVSLLRSEEIHQQKQLFEPHAASQSYNGVTGNDQDSYMLAYHASHSQGNRPQSDRPPSEHLVELPNLPIPRGERHHAAVAHGTQNSGERLPTEQERLLFLNQLKREQSEAIARARAIAQSPPVIVSNDISAVRHTPANYIKQVQIQQVAPVSAHNQVAEQDFLNLQGHNQIPAQHYVNVQSQNQVSAPHYANLQSQNQASAPHYASLQSQNQVSAQHYAYLQSHNQVPVQHAVSFPTQHQIQAQQAIDVPTQFKIQGQHFVNFPSQNQLSTQRHYPQSLTKHYAVPATQSNNVEVERPVQYEEAKKVYVNVERQVPVGRYVGVENHVAGPSRQEVHLQAYSQEPTANLRHAFNAQRHY